MEVILIKIESVRRCIRRVLEEYGNNEENLYIFNKQDSIVLNLQRACEQVLDIANYLIAKFKFAVPKTSRESFVILKENLMINEETSIKMQKMVGFRNIAVHDYQRLNLEILKKIIEEH